MQSASFALRAASFLSAFGSGAFRNRKRERKSSFPFTVFKYSCCSCLRTKFLSAASSGGRLFFSRLYLVLYFRSSIIIIRGVRHVISQPRARSNQKGRAKTFSPPGSARAIRKFKIPESSKSSFFGTNFLLQPPMRGNFSSPPNNAARICKVVVIQLILFHHP